MLPLLPILALAACISWNGLAATLTHQPCTFQWIHIIELLALTGIGLVFHCRPHNQPQIKELFVFIRSLVSTFTMYHTMARVGRSFISPRLQRDSLSAIVLHTEGAKYKYPPFFDIDPAAHSQPQPQSQPHPHLLAKLQIPAETTKPKSNPT
ncbi:hypothetical protein GJ744_006651 [Endocarpon pusillum]|uniref:Uncharacterized protein n=1 Tax=Endocarpon pusillum TaxID=364733 RepID=A0A8H7E5S3_9EURO|nr:hypothetical protein GJ744_006651 [Endocarpon pusillum]